MDESLQELENELKNLSPRRPSRALEARVEAELAAGTGAVPPVRSTAAQPARATPWLNWPLAAAAALALAATTAVWRGFSVREPASNLVQARDTPAVGSPAVPAAAAAAPAAHYRPVGAASVLYDLKDDGNVDQGDSTPVHRLHYRYVDTYTWRNPATNASLKWSVPREEFRVLPASLH